jgi:transcriptional regulator with XRE-family HTH domain
VSNLVNEPKPMKRFGEKLRTLRQRRGLTMRQLGQMLEVSDGYVSKMETGDKLPNVAMVIKVARLFKVTSDQLIMDDQELA